MRLGVYMGLSGNIDRLKELKMEKSQGWDKEGQRGGPETQAFSPSGEHCNLEHWERSVTAVDTGVGNECPEETRNTSVEDRQLDANRLGSFPLHLVPYWEGTECVGIPELLWKGEENWKGIWTWKVSESLSESSVFNLEEPEVFVYSCYFFDRTVQHARSSFPSQGLNPSPLQQKRGVLTLDDQGSPWAWVSSYWKNLRFVYVCCHWGLSSR